MEKILILLLALLLSACQTTPNPVPYVLSVKNKQAGEYQVTQACPVQFNFVKWHPMSDVDGYFCISPAQAAEYLREYRNYQTGQGCP